MNDGYAWWLVLVGLGVGVAVTWLTMTRLPRQESDVGADEREEEAVLIAATIEGRGGVCPPALALEVLDLHEEYVVSPTFGGHAAAGRRDPWPEEPDV
jgi:hypothetical protein